MSPPIACNASSDVSEESARCRSNGGIELTKSQDAALYELWLTKKDGDAFAELARRHAPVVYDLAARALGDRTAAEDVVQEALLDLALEPTRKPAEVGVVAWLARFAICRARNQRSSEKSRARRQHVVGLRRPEETMPDEHLEQKEELDRALSCAEPEERAVLAMRYLHGWEYDRIAQALETSEGAARVRVHRALTSVRERLGVEEARVSHRLAAMPLLALPAGVIDRAVRSALDAAGVPVPAAPPAASRLSQFLRAGVQTFGAALLIAGASSSLPLDASDGAQAASLGDGASPAHVVTQPGAGPAGSASAGGRTASAGRVAVPRPENWDGGALARLARGEPGPSFDAAASSRSESARSAPAAEPAAPAPGVAPLPAQNPTPTSALRPDPRGASAANCDPGSSDDGRADALGGVAHGAAAEQTAPVTERVPAIETRELPADEEPAVLAEEMPRRAAARGRAPVELDTEQLALVQQAAELVRSMVVGAVGEDEALQVASKVRRTGVREVRRKYKEASRHIRETGGTPAPKLSRRKLARLDRVLHLLVDIAFSQGRDPAEMRWPDGVDVATALQEVIRVLSAAPPAADSERRPDLVASEPQPGPADDPATAETR